MSVRRPLSATVRPRRRGALWPAQALRSVAVGVVGGVALLAVELVHRPDFRLVGAAFVANSGAVAMVLALAIGSVVALPLAPTDVALGRDVYLRLAGVAPARIVRSSLVAAFGHAALATAATVVTAAVASAVLLPRGRVDADYLPWPFAARWPELAEVVVWLWMAAAACLVASLVHVGSSAGVGRILSGLLAPLAPVLVAFAPGPVGYLVEDMVDVSNWFEGHGDGAWAVLGGAVVWSLGAAVAGVAAALLARRRTT